MTDFVLSDEVKSTLEYSDAYKLIRNYAKFLKQPLTLGMFVPVDKHGVVLEEPKTCCSGYECGCMGMPYNYSSKEELDEYLAAENFVLFKNATIVKASQNTFNIYIKKEISLVYDDNYKSFKAAYSIEDLANSFNKRNLNEFHIELTQSAIKQIGL